MDDATRREIEKVAWQTLRDAGLTEPPISLELLLDHLELFREFYDLQNPGFLDRAKHRMRINGRKILGVLTKIKLQAVLFHDESRIVVDDSLPEIKKKWPSFHEATHKILVWHRPYFYGDTAQTLDPDWHQQLEAEANCGASALMFCGPVFTEESRDTKPDWGALEGLKKRYDNSYSTTLRRYVRFGPEIPMAMLASTPAWKDQPSDQETRCRHFVVSPSFAKMFTEITPGRLRRHVDANATKRRGGIVADFTLPLKDDNGRRHEFRAESFFNWYYLQTLFVHLGEVHSKQIVLAGNGRMARMS